jgi:hypothetical protein
MKRTGTPLSFLRCSLKSIFLHPSWYKYNPYFADDTPSGEEIGMYVGYMYVMIQPFEIGFNKPYKAIRPIHTATTTRVTTLNLARKPCIVGSTFYSLSTLLRISFCPDQELLPLTTKKNKPAMKLSVTKILSKISKFHNANQPSTNSKKFLYNHP